MSTSILSTLLKDQVLKVGFTSWKEFCAAGQISKRSLTVLRQGQGRLLRFEVLVSFAKALQLEFVEFLNLFVFAETQKLQDLSIDNQKIDLLLNECQQLRQRLDDQKQQLSQQHRDQTFSHLRNLIVQLPTARQAALSNSSFPASNLVKLLKPLDTLFLDWGYQTIGSVWQPAVFDPYLHQPDTEDIQPGEQIHIRFVGYRLGEQVMIQAKVSRTLPAGAA